MSLSGFTALWVFSFFKCKFQFDLVLDHRPEEVDWTPSWVGLYRACRIFGSIDSWKNRFWWWSRRQADLQSKSMEQCVPSPIPILREMAETHWSGCKQPNRLIQSKVVPNQMFWFRSFSFLTQSQVRPGVSTVRVDTSQSGFVCPSKHSDNIKRPVNAIFDAAYAFPLNRLTSRSCSSSCSLFSVNFLSNCLLTHFLTFMRSSDHNVQIGRCQDRCVRRQQCYPSTILWHSRGTIVRIFYPWYWYQGVFFIVILFLLLPILIAYYIVNQAQGPCPCCTRFVCLPGSRLSFTHSFSIFCFSFTNSVQGITWRLAYGIDEPDEPEGLCTETSTTHISDYFRNRMAKPLRRLQCTVHDRNVSCNINPSFTTRA